VHRIGVSDLSLFLLLMLDRCLRRQTLLKGQNKSLRIDASQPEYAISNVEPAPAIQSILFKLQRA
jgi:hypothetical protein